MKDIHEWIIGNQWILMLPFVLIIGYYIMKWRIEQKKYKQRVSEESKRNKFFDSRREKIEFFVDDTPAKLVGFGRKINWLAIKYANHENIGNEFRKPDKKSFRTNFESGVYGAYASNIFVYPQILGWTIVIHPNLNIDIDEQLNFLKELSKKYHEVQFFGSFRGVGYSAWAKFINGNVIRAYSVADGKVYRNIGDITQTEEEFAKREMQNAEDHEELEWIKGEGKWLSLSSEENVLEIAEKWSINPDKMGNYNIEGLGIIIET